MKLSFNGATTMKADLATDIRAAAAAGFDYVEIWAAKLRKVSARNLDGGSEGIVRGRRHQATQHQFNRTHNLSRRRRVRPNPNRV
jgi:sugar phosphate isomerase/epimerase